MIREATPRSRVDSYHFGACVSLVFSAIVSNGSFAEGAGRGGCDASDS